MKSKFIVFLALAAVMLPFKLFAVNASVGANVWYAWYEPGFKDDFMGKNYSTSYNNTFKMNSSSQFVYGGLFAVQFTDRLSLGGVFSYGTGWEMKTDYIYTPETSAYEMHIYKRIDKMDRFEGDLTINYSLNSTFKIFLGWKYFGERATGDYYYFPVVAPSMIYTGEFKINEDSTGPGIGVSTLFKIFNNTYLISTLSGIYQRSWNTVDVTGISNAGDSRVDEITDNFFGGNGILNLAYVIPDTSITLSLGGRYQYLKKINEDTDFQFYGVMLSAIYTFPLFSF